MEPKNISCRQKHKEAQPRDTIAADADVIVIGAGASGLMSALLCARGGKKVLVLEKEILPARKILVTGNGRCNFTNKNVSPQKYFGGKNLVENALGVFGLKQCLDLFSSLGLLYIEEEGRYFPLTYKAASAANCLINAAELEGAKILLKTEAVKISGKDNSYEVLCQNGQTFRARKIILACGSCAYPQTGGSQKGYALARALGHKIIAPSPALCALDLKEKAVSRLAGLRALAGATLLDQNGGEIKSEEGEVIFGSRGISGNNILTLSAYAQAGCKITLDFLPNFGEEDLKKYLKERAKTCGQIPLKDFFCGILADNLFNLLADFLGLRKNSLFSELGAANFDRIVTTIKRWPFTVEGLRPWNECAAARGGVETEEVKLTFESRLKTGLYITGELLNIDGACGGYNLHFAWASAYCAARDILEKRG